MGHVERDPSSGHLLKGLQVSHEEYDCQASQDRLLKYPKIGHLQLQVVCSCPTADPST